MFSLQEIRERYSISNCKPKNVYLIDIGSERHLKFCHIDFVNGFPKILGSLIIQNDLQVGVCKEENFIKPAKYSHIFILNRKSKISSFSKILNLCAFIKTLEQRTDDHVDKVIKEMNEIALHSSDDQVKKISFLLEQISLLLEPKKRQYSN